MRFSSSRTRCLFILLLSALVFPFGECCADMVFEHGLWKVTYVSESGMVKVNHKNEEGSYRPVIISSVPEAHYDNPTGTSRSVLSTDFAEVKTETTTTDDAFGAGTCFSIVFSRPKNGDDITLTQHCFFFENHPWMLTSLEISSPETIRSNYLAPVSTRQAYVLFNASANNRVLQVPFDNDSFVRYGRHSLNSSVTSYEVTAIYEGESRRGVVIGSVDHDHWKSAIRVDASGNNKIKALCAYSGASDPKGTWDVLPHGKLVGTSISSARFFVYYPDDWRDGMEAFTDACNIVVPKRSNWTSGTPVGWMSWNVMETKNNYSDDQAIMEYISTVLRPMGFHNRQQAPNVMSIDAWSNLNGSQERQLCNDAVSLNSIVGCYGNPFSLWWGSDKDLDNIYYEGSLRSYTGRDVVLTANGKPLKFEGAFCLDPTHPAVKSKMVQWIRERVQKGFKYMKLDFVTCGIIQADSYYNPDVHTAVEAYNEGFSYFCRKVDEADSHIFILNSIAPLFPYQYANARRVSCDTWGSIGWTEYSMNALTAGWWTSGIYQFNDPDGVPLIGNGDQEAVTLSENRARLTNAIATGMVLLADNFSLSSTAGHGKPDISRKRAENLLSNADICSLIGTGHVFRPIYGYNEFNGKADGAESFAMLRIADTVYVAIVNYSSSSSMSGRLPLDLLGVDEKQCTAVRELWFGNDVELSNASLPYVVPAKDARIYRITLANTDGVETAQNELARCWLDDHSLWVKTSELLSNVTVYSPSGTRLAYVCDLGGTFRIPFEKIELPSVLLVQICFANGLVVNKKIRA